jgi:hypothetical protein
MLGLTHLLHIHMLCVFIQLLERDFTASTYSGKALVFITCLAKKFNLGSWHLQCVYTNTCV